MIRWSSGRKGKRVRNQKLEAFIINLLQQNEMVYLRPVMQPNLPSQGDSDFPRQLKREDTKASIQQKDV